jgi:CRISPR-associated protein Csm4
MKIVKLFVNNGSKFHFGNGKLNSTDIIFHSDSLFSAIVNNYVKIYGVAPKETPRISSLFYFSRDTLYFPRPFVRLNIDEDDLDQKKIKKIRFISEKVLMNIGNKIEDFECVDDFLFLKGESVPSINTFVEPKSFVPRGSGDTTPFEVESFEVNNGGFYFFVDNLEDKKIIQAIHMIRNEGLGGERSSGKGLFDRIEIQDYNFIGKKDRLMSLSLVSPEKEDFEKILDYDLIQRKGYIYSPFTNIGYRKNGVYMLVEGSVFKESINGSIKIVAKAQGDLKHDVFRDGRAFMMGF